MLERLPDLPGWVNGYPCLHPEHNPPNMIVLPPGRYKHTCPGCGHEQTFFVGGVYC